MLRLKTYYTLISMIILGNQPFKKKKMRMILVAVSNPALTSLLTGTKHHPKHQVFALAFC